MIELPSNFVTLITAQATSLISAFGGFITLILGVLLGMMVLGWLIDRMR